MKIFSYGKDGGPDSTVWGFWLIELKKLCSIALLCFEHGSREAFHNHAFNSISWVLRGQLEEEVLITGTYEAEVCYVNFYYPSFRPIITRRERFHKVRSTGRTWVLTFRGPWLDHWREWLPKEQRYSTLTNGRVEVKE